MQTKFSTPLHTFQDGDTHIAAAVDGDNLVIGETRNDEAAAEGRYVLHTVIPLQEAIAIAKAVLAAQQAAEDALIDAQYHRYERAEPAYVPGRVKLEAADYLPF